MSFNYSPKIVTDELALCLDAANTRSYPGSGTVWTDISKSGLSGTLVNGPTFNSANGGSLVFDGVNDYASFGFSDSLVPPLTTVSIFVKLNSVSTRPHLIGRGDGSQGHIYIVVETYGAVRLFFDKGSGWTAVQGTTTMPLNIWHNITITYDGAEAKIYRNSILESSLSSAGTLKKYTTHPTQIGRIGNSTGYNINGLVGQTLIYNRALSQAEITQNYNATKSRFGLP